MSIPRRANLSVIAFVSGRSRRRGIQEKELGGGQAVLQSLPIVDIQCDTLTAGKNVSKIIGDLAQRTEVNGAVVGSTGAMARFASDEQDFPEADASDFKAGFGKFLEAHFDEACAAESRHWFGRRGDVLHAGGRPRQFQ